MIPGPPMNEPGPRRLDVRPGDHVWVIGGPLDALRARSQGFQLRDTVTILLPAGRVLGAFLFRQPLEGTITDTVLKYRTGALNIDGCRISGHVPECTGQGFKTGKFTGNAGIGDTTLDGQPWKNTGGRWPSNLLLVHGQACVRAGDRRIRASGGHYDKPKQNRGVYAQDAYTQTRMRQSTTDHADPEGKETVPAYECQPDCPVRLLDEMSGELHSHPGTYRDASQVEPQGWGTIRDRPKGTVTSRGDAGTASRFYPQFNSLTEAARWLMRLIGAAP